MSLDKFNEADVYAAYPLVQQLSVKMQEAYQLVEMIKAQHPEIPWLIVGGFSDELMRQYENVLYAAQSAMVRPSDKLDPEFYEKFRDSRG